MSCDVRTHKVNDASVKTGASGLWDPFLAPTDQTPQKVTAYISYSSWTDLMTSALFINPADNITDPNALKRAVSPDLGDMTEAFSQLSSVAQMLFPGMREMTKSENNNLRSYYKKLLGKV
jgi:hypothetical protein